MKAIVQEKYGPPDVLRLADVDVPSIGDGDVLVEVHAAALNPYDWHILRGDPRIARLAPEFGLRRPKARIAGLDGAGRVAAVGGRVEGFAVGDPIFGFLAGSLAEFATADAGVVARKPESLSFEQAASLPLAGVTALQCLRDGIRLRPGQSLLVNGAAGGIGTLAVQLARTMGAEVTGVCSTRNVELVRSLGAHHVIDYTREDFTRGEIRYDAIFDNAGGGHSLRDFRRVLTPTGTFLGNYGGAPGGIVGVVGSLILTLVADRFTQQRLTRFLAKPNSDDLRELGRLVADGSVVPVLDRTYPLVDTAEALRQVETGHVRGKVTVTVQG